MKGCYMMKRTTMQRIDLEGEHHMRRVVLLLFCAILFSGCNIVHDNSEDNTKSSIECSPIPSCTPLESALPPLYNTMEERRVYTIDGIHRIALSGESPEYISMMGGKQGTFIAEVMIHDDISSGNFAIDQLRGFHRGDPGRRNSDATEAEIYDVYIVIWFTGYHGSDMQAHVVSYTPIVEAHSRMNDFNTIYIPCLMRNNITANVITPHIGFLTVRDDAVIFITNSEPIQVLNALPDYLSQHMIPYPDVDELWGYEEHIDNLVLIYGYLSKPVNPLPDVRYAIEILTYSPVVR
jgi:hypothetical protein